MYHDFLAPARGVFIGLDNNTFVHLNDNGYKLFGAAVQWALQQPEAAEPFRACPGPVVQ